MVTAAPADGMLLDEHRTPDGTRPLQIGRPSPTLTPAYLDKRDTQPITCFTAQWSAHFGAEPPASCLRTIQPGFHFLAWHGRTVDGRPNGQRAAYCVPCAIREWAHWQVSEIRP